MPLMNIIDHSSETFKKSVHYRTVSAWNALPKETPFEEDKCKSKLCAFKQLLFNYYVKLREGE